MLPDADPNAIAQRELQQLRTEHGLLAELLQVDRRALRDFMTFAARTLTRLRTQLHRRAREPEQFRRKLERLRSHYAQLLQRAAALPMPSLVQLFADTMQALDPPASAAAPTGDALLPALVHVDAVFLALTTIAQRTGMPLVARRAQRRRPGRSAIAWRAATGHATASTAAPTRLELALRQLGERLATEMGKRIELTTHGLEQVPDDCSTAFYDMLSQMLRNAIEHGIETPAERSAAGKSARGALLVEFQPRNGGHSELIFQDDGRGLNVERIVHAAVSKGMIAEDATLAQDPRQASRLIFHSGVSTAANMVGRGLGMGIVRDNVKRLNGQIQVATKRGQFTRIRIRLPTAATLAMRPVSAQA
jgi:signal transduction histidine kinase